MLEPIEINKNLPSLFCFDENHFQLLEATGPRPEVCILMPTYNHSEFIPKAIEGVLSQKTKFPLQLCISDDCSNDETLTICIDYQKKFPKQIEIIFALENTQSKIISSLYHRGLASGSKYISFCEGDDYWIDTSKIQKQVDLMEKNKNYSGCCHDAKILDKDGKIVMQSCKERPHFHQVVNSDHIVMEKGIVNSGFKSQAPTASFLFRKKVIESTLKRFNGITSDVHLMLTAVDMGDFFYIDEVMSVYRHHPDSWSFSPLRNRMLTHLNRFESYNKDEKLMKRYKKIIEEKLLNCIDYFLSDSIDEDQNKQDNDVFYSDLKKQKNRILNNEL